MHYHERQDSDFCGARVASKVLYITVQKPAGYKKKVMTT